MKKIFISSLTITVSVTLGMAQVTLERFDDPNKQEFVEKMTFGKSTPNGSQGKSGTQKTFDIQENNPYNKLNASTEKPSQDGSKVYKMTSSQFRNALWSSGDASAKRNSPDNGYLGVARSHNYIKTTGDRAVISYNMFLYGDNEPSDVDRVSSIYVFDPDGNVTNSIENIPLDAYEPVVTSNGKYLFYFYGERMAHSGGGIQSGFRIIDLEDESLFFEQTNVIARGTGFAHGTLLIIFYSAEGKRKIILDESDGSMYKLTHDSHTRYTGYLKFQDSRTGEVFNKEDLIKLK